MTRLSPAWRTGTSTIFHSVQRGLIVPLLALLLLSLVGTSFGAETAKPVKPIRIAIIAEDESVRKEADLLTVELSQKPGLELLERTQIEKIFQEQAISATQKGGMLQLGRLLGADGLIIIETQPGDGRSDLSLRLVAVKPGVVLDQISWPRPVPETAKAVSFLAKKWDAFWPKLAVTVRDAVPISILNLRSALGSLESERQERELTFLLASRLTREVGVFVLERRRLQDAGFENQLQGSSDGASRSRCGITRQPPNWVISFWPSHRMGSPSTPRTSLPSLSVTLPMLSPGGSCRSTVATPAAGTDHTSTATETPPLDTRTIGGWRSLIDHSR